jgi:hypothetical protein
MSLSGREGFPSWYPEIIEDGHEAELPENPVNLALPEQK